MADRRARAHLPAPRGGGRVLSRRRGPERLPGLVDSHAHLQHPSFDADRDAVIARAVEAGLERILVPGWDVASSEAALELAARYPDVVDAAVGIHPHDAAAMDEAAWARLEALVADPQARAVGEIGLDFFRNLSPPDVQRRAFDRQLALADELRLPVLVHDRDAHEEVIAGLLARGGRRGGVLHAFSGDAAMAAALRPRGFLVSFALPVAFRSAIGPRAAARAVAADGFLVETDAPYLGADRDARNEPTTALRVVVEIARLREVEPSSVAVDVRATYGGMFDT